MAPKRKRPSGSDGGQTMPKTIVFARSFIRPEDVELLEKNRMVTAARAAGFEAIPKPRKNEVVIFCYLLFAGLHFELDPVVVDILRL